MRINSGELFQTKTDPVSSITTHSINPVFPLTRHPPRYHTWLAQDKRIYKPSADQQNSKKVKNKLSNTHTHSHNGKNNLTADHLFGEWRACERGDIILIHTDYIILIATRGRHPKAYQQKEWKRDSRKGWKNFIPKKCNAPHCLAPRKKNNTQTPKMNAQQKKNNKGALLQNTEDKHGAKQHISRHV